MTPGPVRTPPLAGRKARLRASRFPYGYGVNPLSLATAVNSPARVSRRTARPRSTPLVLPGRPGFLRGASPLSGRAVLRRPVSGSFHSPSGVLFSFPSRYLVRYRSRDVFSLGGRCPPSFPRQNQAAVLWNGRLGPPRFSLRGYHPLRRGFPAHFGYRGSGLSSAADPPTPHLPAVIPRGFGLGFSPFGRPYSGNPMLVSLPPPTKMFPFGGFPSGTPGRTPVSRTPRGATPRQEFPFGDPGFNGCLRLPRAISPLAAPFVGARAEPSTGRLRAVGPQGRGGPGRWPWALRGAHRG